MTYRVLGLRLRLRSELIYLRKGINVKQYVLSKDQIKIYSTIADITVAIPAIPATAAKIFVLDVQPYLHLCTLV